VHGADDTITVSEPFGRADTSTMSFGYVHKGSDKCVEFCRTTMQELVSVISHHMVEKINESEPVKGSSAFGRGSRCVCFFVSANRVPSGFFAQFESRTV
jgi:hypothetical protein